MGLLAWLRDHVAQRKIKIFAVIFPTFLPEHWQRRAHRVFPHRALVAKAAVERVQFRHAGTFPEAEFDATAADEVECRHAFRDPRGMIGRQLHDAVAKADLLRALAGRGEKDFGRGGVGILFEKVVLDFPGVIEAQLVGQFNLVQRVVEQLIFAVREPGLGQLQFVENAEFHFTYSAGFVRVTGWRSRPETFTGANRGSA